MQKENPRDMYFEKHSRSRRAFKEVIFRTKAGMATRLAVSFGYAQYKPSADIKFITTDE
jgi:hypothetical protein